MLPPYEALDGISVLHSRAFEDPVLFVHARPIGAPIRRVCRPSPHEKRRIRPVPLPLLLVSPVALRAGSAEFSDAADRAIRRARRVGKDLNHPVDRVPAQECRVDAGVDRALHVPVHGERPIFVVAHRQKRLCAHQPRTIGVCVDVGDVGNIVALLFHPERERELPEEKLSGTL